MQTPVLQLTSSWLLTEVYTLVYTANVSQCRCGLDDGRMQRWNDSSSESVFLQRVGATVAISPCVPIIFCFPLAVISSKSL